MFNVFTLPNALLCPIGQYGLYYLSENQNNDMFLK